MINKTVIKRDGREKEFCFDRIHDAIRNAYKEVSDELTFKEDYNFLKPMIEERINKINDKTITIEEIQDIVVEVLSKVNKTVADSYNDYRKERDEARRKRSKREQFYKEVLQCTNVDNDNANVDQYSFSGRKYRITDYEQKMFALRNLISKEGREAFESGEIYYHDLSSYAIGEFNCMNLKVENGFEHGFSTRNGGVRGANSFSTACQLLAVMFQVESQSQFGGVGASALDFQMEKYVKKSFRKHFIEGLVWLEYYTEEKAKELIGEELMNIDDDRYTQISKTAYKYAMHKMEKEGKQSCEALFHNLNTLN